MHLIMKRGRRTVLSGISSNTISTPISQIHAFFIWKNVHGMLFLFVRRLQRKHIDQACVILWYHILHDFMQRQLVMAITWCSLLCLCDTVIHAFIKQSVQGLLYAKYRIRNLEPKESQRYNPCFEELKSSVKINRLKSNGKNMINSLKISEVMYVLSWNL